MSKRCKWKAITILNSNLLCCAGYAPKDTANMETVWCINWAIAGEVNGPNWLIVNHTLKYQLYWNHTWWRHQMETFSALLALCVGNSPVPGEFPLQRPVTRSFGVFFYLRLNKRLNKQTWGRWFETSYAHYDVAVMSTKMCYKMSCYSDRTVCMEWVWGSVIPFSHIETHCDDSNFLLCDTWMPLKVTTLLFLDYQGPT